MSFTPLDNESCSPDDWMVKVEKIPSTDDEKTHTVGLVEKKWIYVKKDIDGFADLTYSKPDFHGLVDQLVSSKTYAIIFDLNLSKTELRMNVEVGNTTTKVGTMKTPSDREDYRDFLKKLNDFSSGDRTIVSDADFKKFNADFPKKPSWKTFDELARVGSKDENANFRTWAKTKPKSKAPLAAFDAAKKPAEKTAAAKAVEPFYQDWLKTGF
jgi:hypothetical protein